MAWKECRYVSGHTSLCFPDFSQRRLKFGGSVTKQWVGFQVRETKKPRKQRLPHCRGQDQVSTEDYTHTRHGISWLRPCSVLFPLLPLLLTLGLAFCQISFISMLHFWQEKLQRTCTSNNNKKNQIKPLTIGQWGINLNFLYLSVLSEKWD